MTLRLMPSMWSARKRTASMSRNSAWSKKVYIMYTEDTAYYKEEFLEMYKDGELKSEKDLLSEAADRIEKKEKRKGT